MTTTVAIEPRGMAHCETTALGVLLRHQGIDLSEPMLFGLGSGLSFLYWDTRAMDVPFLAGRVKPFVLTANLADRLGLRLDVRETASPRRAWDNVAAALDAGRPVGLQLDSYHLDYFTTRVHFGGHVVAMYGYDDTRAFLVDTDQQGGAVTTGLASLAAARAARGPMTARHRSFTITAPPEAPDPRERIVPAITACARAFLDPPIANIGHRGIEKAARLVPGWLRRAADPRRDLPQAALLMERAGTGGALFRNLYRDFLGECAGLLDDPRLRAGHELYTEAAEAWSRVAALVAEAGETGEQGALDRAGALLSGIARTERAAMAELAGLAAGGAPPAAPRP
ncbi:BtrH N-terminal domain-containing protein [Streptomonospora sp. S1-112]|uniref:BtrH N-terminal domain-containing protein n=1 Tax=Streptomonospora mangrovi TaxID=2883123 RepID=A0A9X3SPC6_9ACTN|nr:BtrH N-terminal domain-containing protein [Streptomonospora mangrovi]MDA0565721.1 BtrH N-terminal domain-containing protein [Streptomonospora mangrovi]